jgi:hypothetical protein
MRGKWGYGEAAWRQQRVASVLPLDALTLFARVVDPCRVRTLLIGPDQDKAWKHSL